MLEKSRSLKIILFLALVVFGGNDISSKDILHSSRDIARYEKRLFRRVRKHEKEDYRKEEHLSMFRCNYVGELIADSLLSSSFLDKIEMQHDAFPRKRFIYGYSYIFPKGKEYAVAYSNWGKPEVSHLYTPSFQSSRRRFVICKELNIQYCIDMGRNDMCFGCYILIDENGNAYYYDTREEDYYPLKERAEEIIDYFNQQSFLDDGL